MEGFPTYKGMYGYLKRQCHQIRIRVFFMGISFPQAPEYPVRVVSIFFLNSQRYTRHTNGVVGKIFNQKSFNSLFGHLWEVELTYR